MTPFEQTIIKAPRTSFHQPSDFPDPIGLIAELQRDLASEREGHAATMRALIEVTREKEALRVRLDQLR